MRSHIGHKPRSVSYARFIGSLAWVCLAPYPTMKALRSIVALRLYARPYPASALLRGLCIRGRSAGSAPISPRFIKEVGSVVTRLSIRLRLSD